MQLEVIKDGAGTEVGNYFVSNYPPFSVWSGDQASEVRSVLDAPADPNSRTPLGLYIHIPFCRKRCKFCYFRVYTDKNSKDVDTYMDAVAREVALYAPQTRLSGRSFDFVYFGGGTPSFLSSDQLERLVARIAEHWSWESAREVTFECEPGTLKKSKLETIKRIGVTRLSLGIEHFDDDVLETNGRAHKSAEVLQAYAWAREVGFRQINVDLIAGMIGDTPDKWRSTVERTLALQPDSLTVYQMEVPHNTLISRDVQSTGQAPPVADWATKRRWVDYAFEEFERAGYVVSSAYTVVKPSEHSGFVYRDAIWHGADMIGVGVASFSHVSGVHFQNADRWEAYIESVGRGELPISRAMRMSDHQRLIREMILQMKLGRLDAAYFREKFGRSILDDFRTAFDALTLADMLVVDGDSVRLTRDGLLRIDALLPMFFEPQFRDIRYT
jgi:coproporphyrinogen III oxidase-like Fe-S oxidoreductase